MNLTHAKQIHDLYARRTRCDEITDAMSNLAKAILTLADVDKEHHNTHCPVCVSLPIVAQVLHSLPKKKQIDIICEVAQILSEEAVDEKKKVDEEMNRFETVSK